MKIHLHIFDRFEHLERAFHEFIRTHSDEIHRVKHVTKDIELVDGERHRYFVCASLRDCDRLRGYESTSIEFGPCVREDVRDWIKAYIRITP